MILACSMSAIGATYIGVPKGMIHNAYATYFDSDTIIVKTGYGECNGNYFEITEEIYHDMANLASGEGFHYIYVNDNTSDYPIDPNIIDSTTEPSWSDSKQGFYNGNDRCIGVVWSPSGSLTIIEFVANSELKFMCDEWIKYVLVTGSPNGAYQSLTTSSYIPVNAVEVYVQIGGSDFGDGVRVEVRVADTTYPRISGYSYNGNVLAADWLPLKRGSSRNLEWYGRDNDDNNVNIFIEGFQIER